MEKSFLLKIKKDKQIEILYTVNMCAKDSPFPFTFQMCLFVVIVVVYIVHVLNGLGR